MNKREHHLYEFGPYRLVPEERLLLRDGHPVPLTPKAFETLVALVRRAGRLADKDELMKEVWPDSFVEESNLAQNIFALRRALGEGENGTKYIETVPKRGYRFLASIEIVRETDDELSIEQHLTARSRTSQVESPGEALAPGFVAEVEKTGVPIAVAAPAGMKDPEKNSQSLQRAASSDVRDQSRPATGNVAIFLALLAMALGGGALIYKFARRTNPPSSFQTMKMTRLTTSGKVFDAVVSPDGKHVAYAIRDGARQSLWIRQTATQSEVQIVEPAEHAFTGLNFSPDGNHIYYGIYSPAFPKRALFQVDSLGGAPKKILENLRAEDLSFSPDGRQFSFIRFVSGKESTLMIANADGTGERTMLTHHIPEHIHYPAWSPDGKRIAYVVTNNETNDCTIFEAQVADGSTKPLTARRWFRIIGLSWLSDGRGLMMLATPDQNFVAHVWKVSYPEGEAQRLTNDLDHYENLSLTADSRTLVVVQSETQANIWVGPVGDLGRARAVTTGTGKHDYTGSWTPDGRIVYTSNASGTDDIWITGVDGTSPKQLTANSRINQGGAVSPDGSYIVFTSDRTGVPHLWRMNLDGGDQRHLSNFEGGEQNAQFSPDGKWIVYRRALGKPTVWKMPAGGGEPVQLSDKISLGPTVSPDGQWVAYSYNDGSLPRIAIAPLAGGEPLKTFPLPRTFLRPIRWTPDGRAVAYIDSVNGISQIVAQPLDGGTPVPLTDFKADLIYSFAFSPDGKQLAISRGTTNRDVVLIRDFK